MPMLVSNYQKKEFVTRLQRTYNTLSNAFVSAQVDYGDSSKWDYDYTGVGIDPTASDENKNLARNSVVSCIQKYILPYLAKGYTFNSQGNKKLADFGYSSDLLYRDSSELMYLSTSVPYLILNDGTWIFFSYLTFVGKDSNGEERRTSNGLRMLVDINGPKPPNTLGRDIYIMNMYFTSNSKLTMFMPVSYNYLTNLIIYKNSSREDLLENCKTKGSCCGALIQRDGWQIKDDYPW